MRTLVSRLIIEKCAQTIEDMIAPELSSEYLAEQAMAVVMLLRCVAPNMEENPRVLREENQKMQAFLEKTQEVLGKEDALSQNAAINELLQKIDKGQQRAPAGSEDVEGENEHLRETLLKALTVLDSVKGKFPEKTMSSLRSEMVDVIKQQVDHEVAWMEGI